MLDGAHQLNSNAVCDWMIADHLLRHRRVVNMLRHVSSILMPAAFRDLPWYEVVLHHIHH